MCDNIVYIHIVFKHMVTLASGSVFMDITLRSMHEIVAKARINYMRGRVCGHACGLYYQSDLTHCKNK